VNELEEAVNLIIAQSLQDARRAYHEAKEHLELAESTTEERRESLTRMLNDIVVKQKRKRQEERLPSLGAQP
jgi:hypothetical protein